MKTAATLALVAILAACGSDSNGPIDKPADQFSGTWTSSAYSPDSTETLHFTFFASQTANAVSGTAEFLAPFADTFTIAGTSTPPAINFGMEGRNGYAYAGRYVASDSIDGAVDINGFGGGTLSLKKNSNASGGAFSGSWSGFDSGDGFQFVLNASQTGDAVSGSGIASTNGAVFQGDAFAGTSTPPSVNFAWTFRGKSLTYAGTYITADSVAGILHINGVDQVALSLKKN